MAAPHSPRPDELSLLGAPHFSRDAARHDVPDTVPGYLLAVLAMRGDWMTRDELSVLFWPEAANDEAQHNLRVNLNRLRHLLRAWGIEERLESERRRLRVRVTSDVTALRDALARADWLAAANAPHGTFLQGLSFRAFAVLSEWAATQRDALRADWRRAIVAATPIASATTQLELASRYLDADPLDESMMRLQLTALLALGRLDDARRQLDAHDRRLRSELGDGAGATLFELMQQRAQASASDTPAAPAGVDVLIGRDADLARLVDRVRRSPLVTLSGMGGVGKTRLAHAAQAASAAQFSGGTLWLSLSDMSGVAELWRQMADQLAIALPGGGDPVRQLGDQLASRALLIVLDNVEPVLTTERAALNAGLDTLLAACPHLRVLATSREPLRDQHEDVLSLQGLALPAGDSAADVLSAPAVQLFVALARRVRGGFEPMPVADALGRIAHATGGLPLALRIAAAWTRLLSCRDIAAELEAGLDALSPTTSDSAGVRAVLDSSWQRLDAAQRQVLAQLSVFAGAFDVEAARMVGDATLPALAALADASLLETVDGANDDARFDLHPLVRQFARERLAADPRWAEATRERHARHVARQLAPFADWLRADQRAALIKVGQLHDEVIAAWRWALGKGDVDFVTQVASLWANWCEHKGRWDDGIALLAQADRCFDEHDRRELAALAAAARGRALLLHRKADAEASQSVARQALAWSRAIDHRAGTEEALNTLALILRARGRFAEALEAAREALAMAQADGNVAGETVYAGTVAFLELMQGHYDETERLWRHVLALHQRSGHWSGAVGMLNNLGNLLCRAQRWDEALPLLEEGLRLCDKHGFTAMRPFLLATLAGLHFGAGRHDAAREFTEIALAEARRSGVRQIETVSLLKLADLSMLAGDLAASAQHLADALAMAAAGSDVSNQLGALDGYARWLELRGDASGACRAWHTLLAQPQLHAELRDSVTRRLQAHDVAATVADAAQQRGGMVLLTEQALRQLRQTASVAA